MCNCDHCKFSRRANEILELNNISTLKSFIHELLNLLIQTEADLNYHQAILDGSWPTSVSQLRRALEKAENIHSEEILEEIEKGMDGQKIQSRI